MVHKVLLQWSPGCLLLHRCRVPICAKMLAKCRLPWRRGGWDPRSNVE